MGAFSVATDYNQTNLPRFAELIDQVVGPLIQHHPGNIRLDIDVDDLLATPSQPALVAELIEILVCQSLKEMKQSGELILTAWQGNGQVELEIADSVHSAENRPVCLPISAGKLGARLQWQNCPQGGSAVTVYFATGDTQQEVA